MILDTRRITECLVEGDRGMFFDIVGVEFDALCGQLSQAPESLLQRIVSEEKFIREPDWNEQGLHVFRCLAAERLLDAHWRHRRLDRFAEHRTFARDGLVVIQDFLSPREWTAYCSEGLMPRSAKNRAQKLIDRCLGLGQFDRGFGMVHIVGDSNDPQRELHTDTYFSNIKIWFYSKDIRLSDGPLHVVPGSHRNTSGKLRWLHETGLIAADPRHPKYDTRFAEVPPDGSMRVNIGGDASQELVSMGFSSEQHPMAYPANTLILADTSAFHRRGKSADGTVRQTVRAQHRVTPFTLLQDDRSNRTSWLSWLLPHYGKRRSAA